MRLIDADEAKKKFKNIFCNGCYNPHGVMCMVCEFKDGVDIFDNAPTVESVPVVHAEWIEVEQEPDFDNTKIVCSNCKEPNRYPTFNENYEVIAYTYDRTKYCPNCGATMDRTLIHN